MVQTLCQLQPYDQIARLGIREAQIEVHDVVDPTSELSRYVVPDHPRVEDGGLICCGFRVLIEDHGPQDWSHLSFRVHCDVVAFLPQVDAEITDFPDLKDDPTLLELWKHTVGELVVLVSP